MQPSLDAIWENAIWMQSGDTHRFAATSTSVGATDECPPSTPAVAQGLLSRGRPLQVDLLGGTLKIEWSPPDPVFMTGPATYVFNGSYRYEF